MGSVREGVGLSGKFRDFINLKKCPWSGFGTISFVESKIREYQTEG